MPPSKYDAAGRQIAGLLGLAPKHVSLLDELEPLASAAARRGPSLLEELEDLPAVLAGPVAGRRTPALPPSVRKSVRAAADVAATPSADKRRAAQALYQQGMGDLALAFPDHGVTQEYLDFLASHRVADDIIDRVRAGQLDMSPDARRLRAMELGFDPERTVYRWDDPGKAETLGRSRNGLIYASLTPDMALEAAQNPYAAYPLWGAARVAGIDPAVNPMDVDALLRRLGRLHMSPAHSQWHQFVASGDNALARTQRSGARLPDLNDPTEAWYDVPAVRYGTLERGRLADYESMQQSDSKFGVWNEKESMVPDMKEMGYQGILVADEAPRSIAYFGATAEKPMPGVRHNALSVLDPEYRYVRNIFASVPFLAAPQEMTPPEALVSPGEYNRRNR
jgi:hypothetical protein